MSPWAGGFGGLLLDIPERIDRTGTLKVGGMSLRVRHQQSDARLDRMAHTAAGTDQMLISIIPRKAGPDDSLDSAGRSIGSGMAATHDGFIDIDDLLFGHSRGKARLRFPIGSSSERLARAMIL